MYNDKHPISTTYPVGTLTSRLSIQRIERNRVPHFPRVLRCLYRPTHNPLLPLLLLLLNHDDSLLFFRCQSSHSWTDPINEHSIGKDVHSFLHLSLNVYGRGTADILRSGTIGGCGGGDIVQDWKPR